MKSNAMGSTGQILYPQVSQIQPKTDSVKPDASAEKPEKGEFQKVLGQELSQSLSEVKPALKFSAHATERLKDRKINFDTKTMNGIRDAIDKAESKGLQDTLVLTKDAALIVNVKNKTVVTAMDRDSLNGNVFTNIDGAVIV